jgi:hypothetical protein
MRKLLVPFLLVLLLPATAFARQPSAQPPASNGTLSVREARGIVQLTARGSMTGRLRGKITITDPTPYDSKRPVVYGATKTTYKNARTAVYEGRNLRFRLTGSLYTLRLNGRAMFISAIGRGQGMLNGDGNVEEGVFFDGVYSLNDEPYHSLPDDPTSFELAAPPAGDG